MMPTYGDEDRIPIDDDDEEIGGPWDPMAQYDLDVEIDDYDEDYEEEDWEEEDWEEENDDDC